MGGIAPPADWQDLPKTVAISRPYRAVSKRMNDPVEENRAAYEAAKAELEAKHRGRTALLHRGEVVGIYNDCGDAYKVGCDNYGLGDFTIQEIGKPPIDLGILTILVRPPGTETAAAPRSCDAADQNENDYLAENRAAYEAAKAELEAKHRGRTALMHRGEVVGIYDDCGDAYQVGCDNYGLGDFTIQEIGEPPIRVGCLALCAQSEETEDRSAARG